MAIMGRFGNKFDGRYLVTLGASVFFVSMWQQAHFTTQSGMSDFFWPLILRGVGLGLLFVPLTNLALAELPMERIPNGTGLFNLTRQLGGSVGIALAAGMLTRLRTQNRSALAEQVSMYSEATRERVAAIAGKLVATGTPQS